MFVFQLATNQTNIPLVRNLNLLGHVVMRILVKRITFPFRDLASLSRLFDMPSFNCKFFTEKKNLKYKSKILLTVDSCRIRRGCVISLLKSSCNDKIINILNFLLFKLFSQYLETIYKKRIARHLSIIYQDPFDNDSECKHISLAKGFVT